MCRRAKFCRLLTDDPENWSRQSPLPPPSWFDHELDLFHEAVKAAAAGDRDRAVRVLSQIRSDGMRAWFDEDGQTSGRHRAKHLGITPEVLNIELDILRRPAKYEGLVFERDGYGCRYCGIRVVAKAVLAACERALGVAAFRTTGTNAQQHGILLGYKVVADHVVPHRVGGRTILENLVTSCPACNYGKTSYTLREIGLDDPRDRMPQKSGWDGLVSFIPALKAQAISL